MPRRSLLAPIDLFIHCRVEIYVRRGMQSVIYIGIDTFRLKPRLFIRSHAKRCFLWFHPCEGCPFWTAVSFTLLLCKIPMRSPDCDPELSSIVVFAFCFTSPFPNMVIFTPVIWPYATYSLISDRDPSVSRVNSYRFFHISQCTSTAREFILSIKAEVFSAASAKGPKSPLTRAMSTSGIISFLCE